MNGEVKQGGKIPDWAIHIPGIWQLGVGITKLVKERVAHGFHSRQTLSWGVFEQLRDEVNRLRASLTEHLMECKLLSLITKCKLLTLEKG